MTSAPCVSIIIVNYNSGTLLQECVNSIVHSLTIQYEVVIADNCSTDGSSTFVSSLDPNVAVHLIDPGGNIGFGAGCNFGAEYARGEWLHFLNPDTLVASDLNEAYRQIDTSSVSNTIYVTQLADSTGRVVKSGFVLPTLSDYFSAVFPRGRSGRWYRGASVIMNRKTFQALGGWSTYTMAYTEDVDLFFRAKRLRIETTELRVPVIHLGEGCTKRLWGTLGRRINVERSVRKFYKQNGMARQYWIISVLQILRSLVLLRGEAFLHARAMIAATVCGAGSQTNENR